MMQAKREMEGRFRMRSRSRADRLQRLKTVQDARKAHRLKTTGGMGLEMTPISFPKAKKVASPRNKDMWVKAWDSESGTEYFYQLDTYETVWSLDEVEGMVEVENPLRT